MFDRLTRPQDGSAHSVNLGQHAAPELDPLRNRSARGGIGFDLPLREGLQRERDALLRVLASNDYAEGLAAFAERRPPRFTGA